MENLVKIMDASHKYLSEGDEHVFRLELLVAIANATVPELTQLADMFTMNLQSH